MTDFLCCLFVNLFVWFDHLEFDEFLLISVCITSIKVSTKVLPILFTLVSWKLNGFLLFILETSQVNILMKSFDLTVALTNYFLLSFRLSLHWTSIPESSTSARLPWHPSPWRWHGPASVLWCVTTDSHIHKHTHCGDSGGLQKISWNWTNTKMCYKTPDCWPCASFHTYNCITELLEPIWVYCLFSSCFVFHRLLAGEMIRWPWAQSLRPEKTLVSRNVSIIIY